METTTFPATKTDFYKNQLEGKSAIEQIAVIADLVDIMGDVFAFNYQSSSYLHGFRSGINSLHTAYHNFNTTLLSSLIESVSTGTPLDWSEVVIGEGYQTEVRDLAEDFDTYTRSVSGTISLFDWFFAHDSMSGSIPDKFRWKCNQMRDFYLMILKSAFVSNIDNLDTGKSDCESVGQASGGVFLS
jgi:hypothetical protein